MANKYQSFDPNTEVLGQPMLGFIYCLRQEEIRPLLEKHGLTDIEPNGWYPLQKWLDVLGDLTEERSGQAMFDFVAVGMKIADMAEFPPEFDTMPLEQVLSGFSASYQRDHRGGDAGEIIVEPVKEGHVKVVVRTPYPDDTWYGFVWGLFRRYSSPGTGFRVKYDEGLPRRDEGGEVTVIHVEWGV